jgi:hypothetical protein
MTLTSKQQELINTVDDYNIQWKCKLDEINVRPSTFSTDKVHDELLYWNDDAKKMRWAIHRETFVYKDMNITHYTFRTCWLFGKGRCRAGDAIKSTSIEIYGDEHTLTKVPANRKEGKPYYGVPFKHTCVEPFGGYTTYDYLYKDGMLYKLIDAYCAKKQLPR